MKKIGFLFILIVVLSLSACAGKNRAIVAELSPYGQINPFVPALSGGCYVDAGELQNIEVTYENGRCTVKTSPQSE